MDAQLKTLWAAALEIDAQYIEDDDNFFEVGGNSISAVHLAAAAEKAGVSLPVTEIFRCPEFSEMASAAKLSAPEQDSNPAAFELMGMSEAGIQDVLQQICSANEEIDVESIEDVYPCTPIQAGIMALSNKHQGSYMRQYAYQIPAGTDIQRFQAAWEHVFETADILRTRLVNLDEPAGCFQMVLRDSLHWHSGLELQEYLEKDKATTMGYGDALTRLAIVSDTKANHYLVWTIHHSIYDRWSLALIWQKVVAVYEGASSEAIRPPPFSNFIQHLLNADTKEHESFWTSYFSGLDTQVYPALPGPTYQPRTKSSWTYSTQVDRRDASDITISTIIQAAWALTLGKHSDSDDVVFGMTLIGRDTPARGVTEVLGPTIATVPVRVSLGNRKIDEFLRQVQTEANDIVPFEHFGLQNISGLNADTQTACQFQNHLVIQPYNAESSPMGCTEIETCETEVQTYGLVVECSLGADQAKLDIKAHFDPEVITIEGVEAVVRHFEQAILQLSHPPNGNLSDIDLFCSLDGSQIARWNENRHLPYEDTCIHEVFQQTAQESYDAPAICSWDGNLTYRELDQLSSTLAQYLIDNFQVGPETCVPLCFSKTLWMTVVMMTVFKAGGAMVPFDPSHPKQRLHEIVKNLDAPVVISSPASADIFASSWPVLCVDRENFEQLQLPPADCPRNRATCRNMAYIIHTSGSTGKPKGVVIEHRSFLASYEEHSKGFMMDSSSRALQFASYSFDMSLSEVLSTLLRGGCVCIPSDYERMNELPEAMNRMMVNWAFLTPSHSRILDPAAMTHLQTIIVGGEALSTTDLKRWRSQNVRVIEAYGPTEAAVISTVNNEITEKSDPANIGRPVGGLCWVVDRNDHDRLCPIDCPGELLLEGPHLARGYLHNEVATAAFFIQSPAWAPNRRFYKTGDLVRQNPDGSLTFLGRKDMQVKLRGQRLELGEIEYQIRLHLGSDVHVAVEIAGADHTEYLVAFICSSQDVVLTGSSTNSSPPFATSHNQYAQLNHYLHQVLPVYMVPTAYIPLNYLPTTLSGKLDRKFLHRHLETLSKSQLTGYMLGEPENKSPPSTEMEKEVHACWSKILKLPGEDIGREDNFFRVGGGSIEAIRLSGAMRAAGLKLSVLHIFQYPILSQMASAATRINQEGTLESKPFTLLGDAAEEIRNEVASQLGIDKSEISDAYHCTPLQEGLMALTLKTPGAYTARLVYKLPRTIDVDRLKSAWEKTVSMNAILRTRIVHAGSLGTFQAVLQKGDGWDAAGDLRSYLDDESNMQPGKPLVRQAIIPGREGVYLALTMHHAVYDGWSLPLILRQVEMAYRGESQPMPPPFSRFTFHLQKADITGMEGFWRSQTAGFRGLVFPDLPQNTTPVPSSVFEHQIDFKLPAKSGINASAAIRLAWAVVLSLYTRSTDVAFGMTLTGRNAAVDGIEKMTGPTLATVPLRIQLEPKHMIESALRSIQEQATGMIPFEHAGMQNISRLSEDAAAVCQAQSLLVIQPPAEDIPGDIFKNPEHDPNRIAVFTGYAMVLECELGEESLNIRAMFDAGVVMESQMQRIIHQFAHVIKQITSDFERPIEDLQMICPEDAAQLQQWNGTAPSTTKQSGSCPVTLSVDERTGETSVQHGTGVACWIVDQDDHGRLIPIGTVGELIIENPTASDASLYPPEGVFVDVPSWMEEWRTPNYHASIYKTGYLAKYRPAGSIDYVGSKGREVKLHGHRVDLEEVARCVQNCLQEADGVTVGVIQPTAGHLPTLTAFVASKSAGNDPPVTENFVIASEHFTRNVREALSSLQDSVPAYMIPTIFIPLQSLPLDASGETDMACLTDATEALLPGQLKSYTFGSVQEQTKSDADSLTEMERRLQQLWAQALNITPSRIGRQDSFFRLGGDSILAMRLVGLARSQGLNISVADIFAHGQLNVLALSLESKQVVEERVNTEPFSLLDSQQKSGLSITNAVQDILPTTAPQVFFLNQYALSCFSFSIQGEIDPDRVRMACHSIVQRHSAMRTGFIRHQSQFLQVVFKSIDLPFDHIHTDESLESACRSICEADMYEDVLSGKPVVKFTLLSHSSVNHAFIVRLSHAQYDGFVQPIILRDLVTAYNKGTIPGSNDGQFSDYMYYCAHHRPKSFDFWRNYLQGSSMTMLPRKAADAAAVTDIHEIASGKLPTALEDITIPTLVNAAFAFILADLVDKEDIIFGIFMNTRDIPLPGIQNMLGPCVNVNPLRARLAQPQTVFDLCRSLRDQYTQISRHALLDLPGIIAQSTDWQSGTKLGCMINHLGGDDSTPLALDGGANISNSLRVGRAHLRDQLLIRSTPANGQLQIQVATSSGIMDSEEAALLARRLIDTTNMFAESPHAALSTL